MLKFNRKIEYALISLKFLNDLRPGDLASASDICEKHSIPYDPTSKVLQTLCKHKLLRSIHGTQGGYQIAKNLSKVSVLELSEAILGKSGITRCTSGKTCDHLKRCNIILPVSNLNTQVLGYLASISLQSLLESPNQNYLTVESTHG